MQYNISGLSTKVFFTIHTIIVVFVIVLFESFQITAKFTNNIIFWDLWILNSHCQMIFGHIFNKIQDSTRLDTRRHGLCLHCTMVKRVPILFFSKIYFMLLMQSIHHNWRPQSNGKWIFNLNMSSKGDWSWVFWTLVYKKS